MLGVITFIAGIILTILLVVGIHEFGHFIVARIAGVKVLRFSIGFGKSLFHWHDKKGTEYVIAAIPLGGYVKMLDEQEGVVSKEELSLAYNRQPFYKKLAIVCAGPLSNLIFAFVIYWIVFMMGFTTIIPLIGKVTPQSIAANAGLKPQQEIISVDNIPTPSWMSVTIRLISHAGDADTLPVTVKSLDSPQTMLHILDLTDWDLNALKPDPLESLGIQPYEPTVPAIIGKIEKDTPAAKSDLKSGDKVLAIDNQKITDWIDVMKIISKSPGKTLNFTLERNNKKIIVPVTIHYRKDIFLKKHAYLGIAPDFTYPEKLLRNVQYNPYDAMKHGWQNTVDFTYLNFLMLGKLLTGKLSLKSLGGPIAIFSAAGTTFSMGITPFLSFLAFISIAIGVVNILPIPGLDGGHVLFQTIELITRKPISMRLQELLFRLGFIFIIVILFQAIINDISRLI